jgi:antibiotic biosynthesis monooxygenase (ABM) superfamily enzyme
MVLHINKFLEEDFRMQEKGLFVVMAKVKPEDEKVFNKWYNEEHLPRVLERIPGVHSGRRYKILEGEEEYQYMALYEFEAYDAMRKAVHSNIMKQLIKEYDEAFGEGGRKRLLAVQLKSLTVG